MDRCEISCPIRLSLKAIGGKWKPLVLWQLKDRPLRFSELQRAIPEITLKMLVQQLRELEEDGLVQRTIFQEIPPRVEYQVTELGATAYPLLEALYAWGMEYRQKQPARVGIEQRKARQKVS